MGCATLEVWLATQRIRRAVPKQQNQRRPKRLFKSQPSSPPLPLVVELFAATG